MQVPIVVTATPEGTFGRNKDRGTIDLLAFRGKSRTSQYDKCYEPNGAGKADCDNNVIRTAPVRHSRAGCHTCTRERRGE